MSITRRYRRWCWRQPKPKSLFLNCSSNEAERIESIDKILDYTNQWTCNGRQFIRSQNPDLFPHFCCCCCCCRLVVFVVAFCDSMIGFFLSMIQYSVVSNRCCYLWIISICILCSPFVPFFRLCLFSYSASDWKCDCIIHWIYLESLIAFVYLTTIINLLFFCSVLHTMYERCIGSVGIDQVGGVKGHSSSVQINIYTKAKWIYYVQCHKGLIRQRWRSFARWLPNPIICRWWRRKKREKGGERKESLIQIDPLLSSQIIEQLPSPILHLNWFLSSSLNTNSLSESWFFV